MNEIKTLTHPLIVRAKFKNSSSCDTLITRYVFLIKFNARHSMLINNVYIKQPIKFVSNCRVSNFRCIELSCFIVIYRNVGIPLSSN